MIFNFRYCMTGRKKESTGLDGNQTIQKPGRCGQSSKARDVLHKNFWRMPSTVKCCRRQYKIFGRQKALRMSSSEQPEQTTTRMLLVLGEFEEQFYISFELNLVINAENKHVGRADEIRVEGGRNRKGREG